MFKIKEIIEFQLHTKSNDNLCTISAFTIGITVQTLYKNRLSQA